MKYSLAFLLIICIHSFINAQIQQIEWTPLFSKEAKDAVFAVDSYKNLYLSNQQALRKIDSTGQEMFLQSASRWGGISIIDAKNPMKILLFSEDQQLAIYLDNTLTLQQNVVDLSTHGFSFVTQIIASSQPDKVWIFDSDNSTITLYSKMATQEQRINNLYGLLGLRHLNQMFEFNNQLFLLDTENGIFILDKYGTLLDKIDILGIQFFQVENDIIYYLKDKKLYFMSLVDKEIRGELPLPVDNISKFIKAGNYFYFEINQGIAAFRFKIHS